MAREQFERVSGVEPDRGWFDFRRVVLEKDYDYALSLIKKGVTNRDVRKSHEMATNGEPLEVPGWGGPDPLDPVA